MPDDIDFPESRALSEAILVRMTPELKEALDKRAKRECTDVTAILRGLAAQSCDVKTEYDLRKSAPRRTRRQIDREETDLRRLIRFIGTCSLRLNEVAAESRKLCELDRSQAKILRRNVEALLAKLQEISEIAAAMIKREK